MATVTFTRGHHYPDRLRAYKVLVDGEVVGRLRAGQTIEVDVQPGLHVVQARIDWCRSAPLEVNVGPRGAMLHVRTGMPGWKILLSILYITIWSRRYLVVEESRPANKSLKPTRLRLAA